MPKKLLIADDDKLFLDILLLGFDKRKAGHEVMTVGSGEHTIRMLSEKKPDMLILDLRMPNLDGFAVLEYMKQNHLSIPVIVVTYYQDEAHKRRSKEFGVKAYLVKSEWRIDQLVEEIEKYLA